MLRRLLRGFDGSYVQEVATHPQHTLQLFPLGVLTTSDGTTYLRWLRGYLEYTRDLYHAPEQPASIQSDQVRTALGLTAAQTAELGRVLQANVFWTSPGHKDDFSWWEAHFPRGLKTLGKDGAVDGLFRKLLLEHHSPRTSIWVEERNAASASAARWFDGSVSPAAPRKLRPQRRPAIPQKIRDEVLLKCRRRCCLCYGLNGDLRDKLGQIAHLDEDPANHRETNLAYLCLDHHNAFDSSTSQTMGFTIGEVKEYRRELWRVVARGRLLTTQQTEQRAVSQQPAV